MFLKVCTEINAAGLRDRSMCMMATETGILWLQIDSRLLRIKAFDKKAVQ